MPEAGAATSYLEIGFHAADAFALILAGLILAIFIAIRFTG